MNRIKLMMAFTLIAIFILPMGVVAQNDVDLETLPDPGITPDSPLWGLDVAIDRIRLAMTFGAEKKVTKGLEIAQKRLSEIKAMEEANKTQAMEKAQEKHEETINRIKSEIEKINSETGNITGIELGMTNHILALEKVMNKVRANENIPNATKQRLMEKFTNQVANAEELKTKVQNKQAQIVLKAQETARNRVREDRVAEDNETDVEDFEEDELENESEDNGLETTGRDFSRGAENNPN